jgi:hypothetical protein
MIEKTKPFILYAGLLFFIGLALGYNSAPTKQVPVEVIKEVEKTKTSKDVITITKETRTKDGTTIIDTITKDRSIIESERKTDKTVGKSKYIVEARIESKIDLKPIYDFALHKRVTDNILIGGSFNTDKQVGVTIMYEF